MKPCLAEPDRSGSAADRSGFGREVWFRGLKNRIDPELWWIDPLNEIYNFRNCVGFPIMTKSLMGSLLSTLGFGKRTPFGYAILEM